MKELGLFATEKWTYRGSIFLGLERLYFDNLKCNLKYIRKFFMYILTD